jgi:hypothetical protein
MVVLGGIEKNNIGITGKPTDSPLQLV